METKKVKKRKLNFRKLLIFLLIIYLISYGVYYVFTEPIRNIIITGNNYVTDSEIIKIAGIKKYPSIFTLNLTKMKKNIKSISLVENVSIKRNYKFQLIITITETKVVFLNQSTNKLMLGTGKYIDNDNQYVGIPTLINYTPEDILVSFAKALGKIDTSIISDISEVEYDPSTNSSGTTIDDSRFKLTMNDGNTIYTNPSKCSILSYYPKIYASTTFTNKKGTFYFDSGDHENYVFSEYGSE